MAKQTYEFEAKLRIIQLKYELKEATAAIDLLLKRIHTLEEDNDKLSQLKKYEPFLKLGDPASRLRLIEKKGVITAPMMDME